ALAPGNYTLNFQTSETVRATQSQSVPEPDILALLGVAVGAMMFTGRRKLKRHKVKNESGTLQHSRAWSAMTVKEIGVVLAMLTRGGLGGGLGGADVIYDFMGTLDSGAPITGVLTLSDAYTSGQHRSQVSLARWQWAGHGPGGCGYRHYRA